MTIYSEWKKDIEEKLKKGFETEKMPTVMKRCPKCTHLTLEYDSEKGRIYCTHCGFEEKIPMIDK